MKSPFCLAAASLLAIAASTQAREIATDTGDPFDPSVPIHFINSPGCASDLGGTCNPFDLGFTANFGAGRTSKIYIYDDGQVTFGAPAAGGGATFGPGSVAGSLSPFVGYPVSRTVFYDRDGGAFNVQWRTCFVPGSGNTDCRFGDEVDLHIVPDYAAKTVGITLDTSRYTDDYAELGADFGYSLGSQVRGLSKLDADSAFSLSVPFGVPEPATWGLLIAGFTATGTAQRRRRGVAAAG